MINPMMNSQSEVDVSSWEMDIRRALEYVWQRVPLSLDPRLEGVEPLVTIEFVSQKICEY